jgi:hypothetical protein
MTPELQAIVQRLEEVEKQVSHLQALVTEQSDPDRAVVARSFVVRDGQGRWRAKLGTVIPAGQTEEHPSLGLLDANENLRACLAIDAEGPRLALYSAKGQGVAEVSEFQDGPRVALFDANGNTRISLKVSEDGSFAYLFSPDGKQHLRLELFSSGQATLVMQDANGDPGLLLATESERGPVLSFFKDNKVIWKAP